MPYQLGDTPVFQISCSCFHFRNCSLFFLYSYIRLSPLSTPLNFPLARTQTSHASPSNSPRMKSPKAPPPTTQTIIPIASKIILILFTFIVRRRRGRTLISNGHLETAHGSREASQPNLMRIGRRNVYARLWHCAILEIPYCFLYNNAEFWERRRESNPHPQQLP